MRKFRFIFYGLTVVIVILWRLISPAGYYATPEIAIEKEKMSAVGEVIATYDNGGEHNKVIKLGPAIVFYDFVPKKTLLGIKYGASQNYKATVNYDTITQECPKFEEWKVIPTSAKERERGMSEVAFTIVQKSENLIINNEVLKFEYEYNDNQYYLLIKLINKTASSI